MASLEHLRAFIGNHHPKHRASGLNSKANCASENFGSPPCALTARASPDAHRTPRSPPGSSEPTRTPPGVHRQPAPLEPLEARLESLGAHRTTCGARRTSVLHGKLRPPIARDDATECPRTLIGASAPPNLLADSDALYPKSAHCVDRVVTKTTSFVGSFTELCTVTSVNGGHRKAAPDFGLSFGLAKLRFLGTAKRKFGHCSQRI
jgi:hypothetical protein